MEALQRLLHVGRHANGNAFVHGHFQPYCAALASLTAARRYGLFSTIIRHHSTGCVRTPSMWRTASMSHAISTKARANVRLWAT